MIERAIEKIKKEIQDKKGNPNIQAIGDYLLKQVEINREAAEKICNENKSIEKCFKEMEKVARKKAQQGAYCMSDNEAFKIIREYYQFEAVQDKFIQVEVDEAKEAIGAIESNSITTGKAKKDIADFSLDIDDYL